MFEEFTRNAVDYDGIWMWMFGFSSETTLIL